MNIIAMLQNITKEVLIMKRLLLLLPLALTILLAACAKDLSSSTYSEESVGSGSQVYHGVIVSMRSVKVKGNSGLGGVAGAATGGVLGSAVGGGRGSIVAGIAGAVAGGIAGNAIDKDVNKQDAIEYIVELDNHKTMSVVQAPSDLRVHDRVLVLDGPRVRVIADTTSKPQTVSSNKQTSKTASKKS